MCAPPKGCVLLACPQCRLCCPSLEPQVGFCVYVCFCVCIYIITYVCLSECYVSAYVCVRVTGITLFQRIKWPRRITHACVPASAHVSTCTSVSKHARTTHIHTCTKTHKIFHTRTHWHTGKHANTRTHTDNTQIHTRLHTDTHTHPPSPLSHSHTHTHTHNHTHTHTHTAFTWVVLLMPQSGRVGSDLSPVGEKYKWHLLSGTCVIVQIYVLLYTYYCTEYSCTRVIVQICVLLYRYTCYCTNYLMCKKTTQDKHSDVGMLL